ncbi:SPT2 chromatin protein [Abeliophyllum distichum]|uniref:SPT2 chromatin protein n=1 Tax=Abeliophyllum distichum TaxID=126358 RepID=A0ABD1TKU4_9LAMI
MFDFSLDHISFRILPPVLKEASDTTVDTGSVSISRDIIETGNWAFDSNPRPNSFNPRPKFRLIFLGSRGASIQIVSFGEYEDLDEYEEYEEEGGGEEYEEEETHQPAQEELEYLELRQRLKEKIRKQMKKELGTANPRSHDKTNALRKDNYGSFFGPSQPVIAPRVIQESKSLLENPNLAARISKSSYSMQTNKSSPSATAGSKPRTHHLSRDTNVGKTKVEMLKNTRDYSFLLSDDADVPAPTKNPPPRNASTPSSEARSAQLSPRSKQPAKDGGKKVFTGHLERKPMPPGGQPRPKVGSEKLAPTSKLSVESKQKFGKTNGSGPGRPVGIKEVASRDPAAATRKKVTTPVAKSSMPGDRKPTASHSQPRVHKTTPSHLQSSFPKKPLTQRKEPRETSKAKVIPKQPISSRPQIKPPPTKSLARGTMADERPKSKPVSRYDEDSDDGVQAISMIRKMFGYNPRKYRDDDDDSDMEANFEDILAEEKRSAKIARKEDEEQLRLIEEEERRERMRLAKRQKR